MLRTCSEVSLEIGGGGFALDPLFPGRFSLACVTSINKTVFILILSFVGVCQEDSRKHVGPGDSRGWRYVIIYE